MRRLALAFLMMAVVLTAFAAAAADRSGIPFTAEEKAIIARNESLGALMKDDPKGVRRILDAIAKAKMESSTQNLPLQLRGGARPERRPDGAGQFDPLRNPDLVRLLQRASPEAAYDLFQILKQVGGKPAAN